MHLITPHIQFKESVLAAIDEYEQDTSNVTSREFYKNYKKAREISFTEFVSGLRLQEQGENLPQGYVPQTSFWLVEDNEFIGSIAIRHMLTDFLLRIGGHIGYTIRPSQRNKGYGKTMLQLALPKAKALGITNVLITCDETNSGSRKIIEANGGVYENSVEQGNGLPLKRRYWITL